MKSPFIFLLLLLLFSSVRSQNETESILSSTTTDDIISENATQPATQAPAKMVHDPSIFGMRVELPPDDPFGFDSLGVCIVAPDEKFKVAIYGNHLDRIAQLIFTHTNNCSEGIVVEATNDFLIHFTHKATFHLTLQLLPETVHAYKMCVKPKGYQGSDYDLAPLDDVSTWISTERPPKELFMPLPVQIGVIGCMLCLSALFSGLTLGLMSLTPQELELLIKSGSANEQKHASKILPIRKKGNLLLCALLLGNVIVNASISILFGELTSGLLALAVSSIGIVIFGEIIPQSICVKNGLAVGAHTIAITQVFIFVTWPLAYPISKLLDCLLGAEYTVYNRKRLMEIMRMSMKDNNQLSNELKIAVGAMELLDKVVENVMTKISDVFMLPDTTILNAKTVAEIVKMGYTRIPVYSGGDKNNVTDLLFVKDLALLDPDDNFTVHTVCGYHKHPVKFVFNDTPLSVMLEAFKKGDGHLAMVKRLVGGDDKDPSYELVGVVTLEDVMEEILQAEINDESDVFSDNVNRKRRKVSHHRDMTKLLCDKEAPRVQVSMQLQIVALQWLVANQPAFSPAFVDTNVLERLIRTRGRRVDVSSLIALSVDQVNLPKLAKLYTKDEMSDRFILILEGRVQVTIGQSGMMFEAGPWHCFGGEVLDKLVKGAATLSRSTSIIDTPDVSCRRPDLMFKPDFSVVVKEDCTYLDINVASYINAYKSTLMQRDKGRDDLSFSGHSRSPSPVRRQSSVQNNVSAPILDPSALMVRPVARQSVEDAKEAVKVLSNRLSGSHTAEETFELLPPKADV